MKKILILTYYWPPSGGAGVQRWLKFTKYLPEFGFEPIILTVDPVLASYPQKDESLLSDISSKCRVYYTKTFELYNLYKFFSRKKEIPYGGFANEKIPGFSQKITRMLRSHLLIPDPRKGWNKYAYRKAAELIREFGIDTVISTSPPHSTQLIGLKLKKNLGIHWIADLRDPWTDIFYYKSLYHSFISASIDRKLERKVLLNADAIITVSQALKQVFAAKIDPVEASKFAVIPNGFDTEDFLIKELPENKEFTITYTGTISNDYKTDVFLKVIQDLLSESYRIKIRFIGKIPQNIIDAICEQGLSGSFEFVSYVPHNVIVKYMQQSDALLLIIPDVKENKGILTGKLFEYIGSERLIIGIGPIDGDAAAILEETQTGKMLDYNDYDGLRLFISESYLAGNQKSPKNKSVNVSKYSRIELTRNVANLLGSFQ